MLYKDITSGKGLYDPAYEHDSCGVGFVANIKGERSYDIIDKGIRVLVNLTHRGAVGADEDTGDGAGIMLQLPDEFLQKVCRKEKITLPAAGNYGVGMIFLPRARGSQAACIRILEKNIRRQKLRILGWRKVPIHPGAVGHLARCTCPDIRQVFIGLPRGMAARGLERCLFVARKTAENEIAANGADPGADFYIVSLSSRTIVYKGLLLATQIKKFYADLNDESMKSALALVHQRYSTNTFPTWPLAQPFRMLAHNGEINTLRGNSNWMRAREKTISSRTFGRDLKKMLPIIQSGGSDSMALDNVLEFMVFSGRSLPHSMMMLVPEAWGDKYPMGADKRGFYEYHSILMEPWDGPAALAFTDGRVIGANLDRNGLRPARYVITKNGLVVMASEAGVLEFPAGEISRRGRVEPGKMFFIDTVQGRIIDDKEIKSKISRAQPYRRWVKENKIDLGEKFDSFEKTRLSSQELVECQQVFGYTFEDIHDLMVPKVLAGKEPVGSMGNDAALAVLSNKPQLLFNYFKQHFAQVTNPAIDSTREALVMSTMSYIGVEHNLMNEGPRHAHLFKLREPILTNRDLQLLQTGGSRGFRTVRIPTLFPARGDPQRNMKRALREVCRQAEQAVRRKNALIILSDRNVDKDHIPIPSLLAVSTVHHHLINAGLRTKIGLVIETGEVREVMHFALLLGYGVSAINPYLAFETLVDLRQNGYLPGIVDVSQAFEKYTHAIAKGLLKVFAKMGISTIRSYRGAQIFEAVGLGRSLIDTYFPGTISRIGGIGIGEVAAEAVARHRRAFRAKKPDEMSLARGGDYRYRRDEERRLWTPETIRLLQQACRGGDLGAYREYARIINEQPAGPVTLRNLLEFKKRQPVKLSSVEPARKIMQRFVTGAMSFGSLSREVHETIAIAMNRIGGMSNSGEGGEDPARYIPLPNGDSRCSAIKQVASGRFGVTIEYLTRARELQIKVAQGAKPGEGGQLPGHKVDREIARVRHTVPGITLISPPPHHDIYSIEDLAQLIYDLKNANPSARVSVKLVSEAGVGTVAAGVAKAKADMILISGYDGGTGASPLSSIRHAGIPWELGLSETQQTLVANNLRAFVRLQVDGQIKTGRDVVMGALLGAEEFGFGTTALVALGCVMMRKCHLNTCPMGVATQDPRLRARFPGRPEHLVAFLTFIAGEVREIMAQLGFRTVDEMIGRADCLRPKKNIAAGKASSIDFKKILFVPPGRAPRRCVRGQSHRVDEAFDRAIIRKILPPLTKGERGLLYEGTIRNVDRSAGIQLSHAVTKALGAHALEDNDVECRFTGVAGQSFGAFLAKGITFTLAGAANDYVGKGLSGGRLVIRPPAGADFDPAVNVIAGNTVLYGATSGEAYFLGAAGERFAIRNSGARAVVERVGDHCCEYMTGGVVVVLGITGVNFAAGMSGGIAFILDEDQEFDTVCNLDMVDIDQVTAKTDVRLLKKMISDHVKYTGSAKGRMILDNWKTYLPRFVKVVPLEYRRVLGLMSREDAATHREEVPIG